MGRPEIQSFAGALDLHKARKGVFITTSSFSRETQEYVGLIEKRIVLIDGSHQGEIVNILLKIKNSFLPTKQILIGL